MSNSSKVDHADWRDNRYALARAAVGAERVSRKVMGALVAHEYGAAVCWPYLSDSGWPAQSALKNTVKSKAELGT